jgi:hypothetical protein
VPSQLRHRRRLGREPVAQKRTQVADIGFHLLLQREIALAEQRVIGRHFRQVRHRLRPGVARMTGVVARRREHAVGDDGSGQRRAQTQAALRLVVAVSAHGVARQAAYGGRRGA